MAKLRRITLVDQVVDELGRLIRETWEGGEELPSISELGDQFGVSRAVVREALKALEAQGMVEVSNGKRARVSTESTRPLLRFFANALDLDSASNGDIAELWHVLEGDAAALAASNSSDAELAAIQELARRSETARTDAPLFARLDGELHEKILLAGHNRILRDLLHTLRDALSDGEDGLETVAETEHVRLNARLVSAISRRDPHAARRAIELHLTTAPPRRIEAAEDALTKRTPVSHA